MRAYVFACSYTLLPLASHAFTRYPEVDGKKQRFSCEWDCHYCPNEPGQPRSYLHDEPSVLRANRNQFDPVLQFTDRYISRCPPYQLVFTCTHAVTAFRRIQAFSHGIILASY